MTKDELKRCRESKTRLWIWTDYCVWNGPPLIVEVTVTRVSDSVSVVRTNGQYQSPVPVKRLHETREGAVMDCREELNRRVADAEKTLNARLAMKAAFEDAETNRSSK